MKSDKKIVSCTYWEGDFRGREKIFNAAWVYKLRNMVKKTTQSVDFVCLSNVPEKLPGIKVIALAECLPGWWSKLEIFKPGQFPDNSRVLNLDLDLLVMKDITPLMEHPGTLAIGTSVGPFNKTVKRGSHMAGVFAFTPGDLTRSIWQSFSDDPGKNMAKYRGDGRFMDLFSDKFTRYPDGWITKLRFCPGHGERPDPNAIIIHCMPDKNNVAAKKHDWIDKAWNQR